MNIIKNHMLLYSLKAPSRSALYLDSLVTVCYTSYTTTHYIDYYYAKVHASNLTLEYGITWSHNQITFSKATTSQAQIHKIFRTWQCIIDVQYISVELLVEYKLNKNQFQWKVHIEVNRD